MGGIGEEMGSKPIQLQIQPVQLSELSQSEPQRGTDMHGGWRNTLSVCNILMENASYYTRC